jgi:hypothetical protein
VPGSRREVRPGLHRLALPDVLVGGLRLLERTHVAAAARGAAGAGASCGATAVRRATDGTDGLNLRLDRDARFVVEYGADRVAEGLDEAHVSDRGVEAGPDDSMPPCGPRKLPFRSVLVIEWFLMSFPVIELSLMDLPVIVPAAIAAPAIATTSTTWRTPTV